MDLASEAGRLRLDLLAVAVDDALGAAEVPHVLLKGPSTSLWLYDPPRPYSDVDMLVPLSDVRRAAKALQDAGVARASSRVGEEAPHSLLMHTPERLEVDLHVALPTAPVDGDRIFDALRPHVEPLELDVGTVAALDVQGRCLVLALHALNNNSRSQPGHDLRLARERAPSEAWDKARGLARHLGVEDLFDGGLSVIGESDAPLSDRARLHVEGAPPVALGLQRLRDAALRDLPRVVWQEVFPSRGFMANHRGDPDIAGWALLSAHWQRWVRILRQVPSALRARRR